jgi:hypothetical protein
MDEIRNSLPDLNRLSITVSTIILAYTLTNFITIPSQELSLSLFGILFNIPINFTSLVSILVAGLTASGTAWLIYDHPNRPDRGNAVIHWLLPSLTSLVLMLAVNQLPFGLTWWIAAGFSGLGILLVLTAEFVVLDADNVFYAPAEIVITALSVALFLLLAVSLHGTEARLFYRVPIISTAALMVFLRIIHLRKEGIWAFNLGAAAFVLTGELAAGFHYLPIGSIGFGVAITGPLFALIEISSNKPERSDDFEFNHLFWPIFILILSWIAAIFL